MGFSDHDDETSGSGQLMTYTLFNKYSAPLIIIIIIIIY